MASLFIFGLGYTALYFTKFATENGYDVSATSRTPSEKSLLAKNIGISQDKLKIINFESQKEIINGINKSDYILISTPPSKIGDPIFNSFKQSIINNKSHIKWIGYLSSTGVYGNHDGAWVNESSSLVGSSESNIKRIEAENSWLSLYKEYGIPVHIFRIAGIYGPNRSAIDKIKSGKSFTVFKEKQFFSRIHVQDISKILYSSIQKPTPGEIYNLADDKPAPMHEVDQYAAGLLKYPKMKIVNFEDANLSSMAKEFFNSNKKIDNSKIKKILNYNFLFPDYKSGLLNIIKNS